MSKPHNRRSQTQREGPNEKRKRRQQRAIEEEMRFFGEAVEILFIARKIARMAARVYSMACVYIYMNTFFFFVEKKSFRQDQNSLIRYMLSRALLRLNEN